MRSNFLPFLIAAGLSAISASAGVPATRLYPFQKADLATVRAIAKGESLPTSPDLDEAWEVYGKLQGSWQIKAEGKALEAKKAATAKLDALKKKLEALPQPDWFKAVLADPHSVRPKLADKVGDAIFQKQKETPEMQALKALALLYLAEHELDRPEGADKAGVFLSRLLLTRPWDWSLHALYARLLVDAGKPEPAWHAACLSLFLNPAPDLDDLKFFAFIGAIAAKNDWPEIQKALREAAPDAKTAEQAIEESKRMFGEKTKVQIQPNPNGGK